MPCGGGDFNPQVSNESESWKRVTGRNGLPDLHMSASLLLGFCAKHNLSITNIILKHKGVLQSTGHQSTLSSSLMIDCRLHVMDA